MGFEQLAQSACTEKTGHKNHIFTWAHSGDETEKRRAGAEGERFVLCGLCLVCGLDGIVALGLVVLVLCIGIDFAMGGIGVCTGVGIG